jgi:hypothetical protein
MPLNPDALGSAIYNAISSFNNKDKDSTGDIETARQDLCKALANAIISHFMDNAVVSGTGLAAPNGPVTGQAKIT